MHSICKCTRPTNRSPTVPKVVILESFLRGEDILKGKADDYCHGLYELYRQASKKNPSLARLEIRVPIVHASDVLLKMDRVAFAMGWLYSIQPCGGKLLQF